VYKIRENLNDQYIAQAVTLVNRAGQLTRSLSNDKIKTCLLNVGIISGNSVIACAAIKKLQLVNGFRCAETGYLVVDESYRGLGLAKKLTEHRIAWARKNRLDLIFTKIRFSNNAAKKLVEQSNFRFWGDFENQASQNMISWYHMSFISNDESKRIMRLLTSS
jgi:GNAT superfamily N-acetyltransferase